MFSYIAYGLGIHSDLPFPELIGRKGATDVVIRFGKVDCSRLERVDEQHTFWATSAEARYFYKDAGAFLVRDGREIIVDPLLCADVKVLRLSILGPAMALLLQQRGRFVLHASAISIHGSAVGFLGWPGWGKSTLAAALHARGHELLTDDVTAIQLGLNRPTVLPSFPQFKLWPDSASALGNVPEAMPLLRSDLEKRVSCVTERFACTPPPLRRLYVLNRGSTLAVRSLSPQETLRELLTHWYGSRFGDRLLQAVGIAQHFLQCASLANKISMGCIERASSLESLSNLARLVEEDFVRD